MPNATLSTTNTGTRRSGRFHRNCQSGPTFNVAMASSDEQFITRNLDEPQSGYLAHDVILFTSLTSLPDRTIRVVRPLRTVVRPASGVYLASLVDTTISASGETLEDAVASLKDIVAAKFRLFSRKENILGDHPRHQLRVLQQSLRAT